MRMPVITTVVGGRTLKRNLLALRMSMRISQPSQVELTFAGSPDGWPLGDSLQIELDDQELFRGDVTAVELVHGPGSESAWVLRGYDLLHRLRKRQTPRVFEDITIADLARKLTADLGLNVSCDKPGSKLERLVQHRQSDWELLAATASRCGRYLVLNGETLSLDPLGDPIKPTLWQVRVEANADRAVDSVTAIGWHPQRGEVLTERASKPKHPLMPSGQRVLVDQPPSLLADAAQAAVQRSAARAVHVSGVAVGDVALRPGRTIDVSGLDDAVDGSYVLTEAVHTVTAEGYQVRISTEPPAAIQLATGASITLGRVTSVADPAGKGRVEVVLPAYQEMNVGWLGVLCPGAGPGKGIVALPDPGDLVVIALPHENPAEGIVLGAIYGPQSPPDSGVEGNSVRRWVLHSGAGQVIVLDDEHKSIKLSNADGSCLELSPDVVSLTAKTDMVIEAPGHHLNIRAANIDFDRAML